MEIVPLIAARSPEERHASEVTPHLGREQGECKDDRPAEHASRPAGTFDEVDVLDEDPEPVTLGLRA